MQEDMDALIPRTPSSHWHNLTHLYLILFFLDKLKQCRNASMLLFGDEGNYALNVIFGE